MFDFFSSECADFLESLHIPNEYHTEKSLAYRYWFRSLLHKIDSSIIFTGLPEGWNNDFFMFNLWARGYVLIFQTRRKELLKFGKNGVVYQPCYLGGKLNFYWQPTEAYVANPNYKLKNNFTLGNNCELLKLTPDYMGVLDIIHYYALKLANLSSAIDMSITNSRFGLIATASNEAQSMTLKAIYDKFLKGESLVVWDDLQNNSDEVIPRKEPFEIWIQELKKNYVLTDQLNDLQTILDQFYTEIGLPVSVEKKERLITSEADFATAQSQARISCWVETLKECLEVINKKFGINIEVDYASTNDDSGNRNRTSEKDNTTINN